MCQVRGGSKITAENRPFTTDVGPSGPENTSRGENGREQIPREQNGQSVGHSSERCGRTSRGAGMPVGRVEGLPG